MTHIPAWQIAFRHHEIINVSSPDKIRTLGSRLGLDPATTVLDLACGTGGPAVILASAYGCRVTGVDHHEPFLQDARRRADAAGVGHLLDVVHQDGAEFMDAAATFDVALCLGAPWILGGFEATARRLHDVVPVGGHVAIGDLFLPEGMAPPASGEPASALAERLQEMVAAELAPITILTASEDDWNTYTSLKWLSIEDWLAENPDHPDAPRHRARPSLSDLAEHAFGWAIVAGRRTGDFDEPPPNGS